jgi:hypothetical protein
LAAAAVLRHVEAGVLALDDEVVINEDELTSGTGILKDLDAPVEITVGGMLKLMIQVSDNTATNKLVDVAGCPWVLWPPPSPFSRGMSSVLVVFAWIAQLYPVILRGMPNFSGSCVSRLGPGACRGRGFFSCRPQLARRAEKFSSPFGFAGWLWENHFCGAVDSGRTMRRQEPPLLATHGYARCAPGDPADAAEQRALLGAAGVPEGAVVRDFLLARADLTGRAALLESLEAGDTLVVAGLERLAASNIDLGAVAELLRDRGVALRLVGTGAVWAAGGPALGAVAGEMARFERRSAELAGRPGRAARAAGLARRETPPARRGPKEVLSERQQALFLAAAGRGEPIARLARQYGISRSTAYKYARREQRGQP